jgi:hypothetical protein
MLTEIFLSFLVTSGIGAFLVICRLLYKSKCKNFELCCIKIERDAEQENNADLIVDMARRMSTSNPLDKEPIIRYENIYKGDLKKNEKKIQDLPSLEEGLGNVTLS